MKIVATQFSLKTKSFEIYLSGCDGYCKNCHNPELWDFNLGTIWKEEIWNIVEKVLKFQSLINWIWILGGEPLLQEKDDFLSLIQILKKTRKELVLFTRFEIDDIDSCIKQEFDYIKTGFYDMSRQLNTMQHGINLSSSNQKVLKKLVDF